MNFLDFKWTHNPSKFSVFADRVEIITDPHTDLWQRTYYHFCNDNAPLLQYKSKEKFFTFTVKCDFEYTHRFDNAVLLSILIVTIGLKLQLNMKMKNLLI